MPLPPSSGNHDPFVVGEPLVAAGLERRVGQLDAALASVIATGSGASTTLTAQALSGQKNMVVAARDGWLVGDVFFIGFAGGTFESGVIASGTGSGAGTLVAVANLANTYASGTPVSKSPIELVNARGTFATLGARLARLASLVLYAVDYGVKADGATDDTSALAAARAAAAGVGILQLPAGTIRITGDAGGPYNYERIQGTGENATIIRQDTNNIPVLKWGGYGSSLTDLCLTYNAFQGVGNTAAVDLELYAPSWCTVERLRILRGSRGIYIKQAGASVGGGGGTANFVASSSFRDLFVQGFSIDGINLTPFAGGNSGCAFENIYIIPRDDAGVGINVTTGLTLISTTDSVFNQINVEGGNPFNPIYCSGCDGITFNSVHFEALSLNGEFASFFFLEGGGYVLNGILIAGNSILVAKVPTTAAIFRLATATRVMVDGLVEKSTTRTTATFLEWLVSGPTGCEVHARGVKTAGTTGIGTPFTEPGNLVQRNRQTQSIGADRGDANVTLTPGVDHIIQRFGTNFTVNRTITLSTTGAQVGDRFRIVRTNVAAFTLAVGAVKTMPSGTAAWCEVVYDGAAWVLVGYAPL